MFFEIPVTKGNKIKWNGDHFSKVCNILQKFCNTLFYNFYITGKKRLFLKLESETLDLNDE